MNLYIQRRPNKMWSSLIDAENKIVGTIRPDVADYLVRQGVAMDLTKDRA
jgi:hypothetical protein